MSREIVEYAYKCDGCGKEEYSSDYPNGWEPADGDWDAVDDDHEDFCLNCKAKHGHG